MKVKSIYVCFYLIDKSFKIPKEAIRIRKSQTNRQHNGKKEKGQKDKQRSTKHTHETKDRVT